ncbi:MAG: hypothetical protein J6W27_01145, partial [Alphaproteobacteria bacterium]|nr:hypothetical protein [Alphaproteobacteria bacterium]
MLRFIRFFGTILLSAILFVAPVNSAEKAGGEQGTDYWKTLELHDMGANSPSSYNLLYQCENCTLRGYNYYTAKNTDSNQVSSITPPSRLGYTYEGHYLADMLHQYINASGSILQNLDASYVNVYASWTPNIYEISLNRGGATNGTAGPIYEKFETGWYSNSQATTQITSITPPTLSGYVFNGYWTGTNCSGTKVIANNGTFLRNDVLGNVTLYACWHSNSGNTYRTITLNPNGGSGVTTNKIYQRTGVGWYRTAASSYPITNTIFAGINNGGAGFTAPTRTNYIFGGYSTTSSGAPNVIDKDGYIIAGPSTFSGNASIYAVWYPVTVITLNANGGTACSTTSITASWGGTVPSSIPCAPTPPSGYIFTGYVPDYDAMGVEDSAAELYCDADLTCTYPYNTWGYANTPLPLIAQYIENPAPSSNVEYFCDTEMETGAKIEETATYGETYTVKSYSSLERCTAPSGTSLHHWNILVDTGVGIPGEPPEYAVLDSVQPGAMTWDFTDAAVKMQPVFSITCSAGTYYQGSTHTCQTCPAGYYCEGVTAQTDMEADRGKLSCADETRDYTQSAAGNTSVNNCYLTTTAGQYVPSNGVGHGQTTCPAGSYCSGGTTIYYGGTHSSSHLTYGGNTACSSLGYPSGYSSGTFSSAAGSTASTACTFTAPTPSTPSNCSGITVNTVTYTGSTWPTPTFHVTSAAGKYIISNDVASPTCGACTSPNYSATANATSCTACSTTPGYPSGYSSGTFTSVSPYNASSTCRFTAPTPSTTPTNCSGISSNTVSYTGSAWNTPTFHVTSAAGKYIVSNDVASPTCAACATGSYNNAANQTSCSVCGSGTTTSGAGKTSCDATCSNNNAYDHAWATPSWNNNSPTGLCKITSCKAGSYYTSTNSG